MAGAGRLSAITGAAVWKVGRAALLFHVKRENGVDRIGKDETAGHWLDVESNGECASVDRRRTAIDEIRGVGR